MGGQMMDNPFDGRGASPPAKGCDCVAEVNKLLAEHNTVLVTNLLGPQRLLVETCKLTSAQRGRPMKMFASFCPFCGVAYPKEGR